MRSRSRCRRALRECLPVCCGLMETDVAEKKPAQPSLIVGPGRLSFPSLFEPRQQKGAAKPRWETNLLLPPDTDVERIRKALHDACVAEFGDPKSWPRKLRRPEDVLMPAPEKGNYAGYEEGWWCLSCANSKERPEIIDAMKAEVTDPKQVYPGRWARLNVRPYAYRAESSGLSLWLSHVQLLKHDTPLAGGPKAKDVFDEVAEAMDDVPF